MTLIAPLPKGPIDIIGDAHGELDALRRLLRRLGCDPDSGAVERPIVFLGDLVDRGPDSPGVCRLVRSLCDRGVASMVLGNHELNVLRGSEKEGNGWVLGHADGARFNGARRAFDSATVSIQERNDLLTWLGRQPLARVRDDLRVVHACWDDEMIGRLPHDAYAVDAHAQFDHHLHADLTARNVYALARHERSLVAELKDPDLRPERVLCHHNELVVAEHHGNPVRAMTSGLEHVVEPDHYMFLGGKWRTTMRTRWWDTYAGLQAVVVGHYWRARGRSDRGPHDLWGDVQPHAWSGAHANVFCLDYCAGRRYRERWTGRTLETGFEGALAAMRWPERALVFDDRDEPIPTTAWRATEV